MTGLEEGRVCVVPYRPAWKEEFEREAEALRSILGGCLIVIEHIGSTAIEGMTSKPLIDVLALVESFDDVHRRLVAIERLGYEPQPAGSRRQCMFFVKKRGLREAFHLFVSLPDTTHWTDKIVFRDYLRNHPEEAAAYGKLKRGLARELAEDREAYTEQKTGFVNRILAVARGQEP